MKKLLVLIPLAAMIFAAFSGCVPARDDLALIQELLLSSYFVGDGAEKVADDESATPKGMQGWGQTLAAPMPDDSLLTVPYVYWVRKLEGFTRIEDVDIDGDEATAVISANLRGTIYVYNDSTETSTTIYERAIDDSTYREVKLKWDDVAKKWYIDALTPLKMWTHGAEHPVKIAKIDVEGTISDEDFEINSPSDFYERDDVPRFVPNDTVEITVNVEKLAGADSVWVYLHHGRHYNKLKPVSHRKPFSKYYDEEGDDDTWNFFGTWTIAEDGITSTPTVRHAAVDVLYWGTLWGDDTAEYSSYVISMPYVVAEEGDDLPDDSNDD